MNTSQPKKHHYVAKWYQRRFMLEEQTSYYQLDLDPIIKNPKAKGRKSDEISFKGPGKFFYEDYLYTTKYLGIKNHDIEIYLFGKIDGIGSLAIPAMVSPNWMMELHTNFRNFLIYMDAQRLRTPKGLNWLTNLFKPKNHNELLLKMQEVRTMHCTMWAEAQMEILSAKESVIKFIVSDNPVTFYNPVFYPGKKECEFPFDPSIKLKGTRTIFPLDANNCIVLTHREYARSPGKFKAAKPRTNARYFGTTIAKYDEIIRGRELNDNQVAIVNYVLKSRAHRYIAAAKENWLYPENILKKKDWSSFDKLFLSKKFKSISLETETFIVGKNGELKLTQDGFGRKPKNNEEWEEKEKLVQNKLKQIKKLISVNKE